MSFKKCFKETILNNKVFKILILFLVFISTSFFLFSKIDLNTTASKLNIANARIESLENEVNSLKEQVELQNNMIISMQEENIVITEKPEIKMNAENVTEKSNINKEQLELVLSDNLKPFAETFIYCEENYNINALFLSSIVAISSDNGNAERINITNNMTGLGVTELRPNGFSYETKEQSIIKCAELLANNYISEDGDYYNGLSVRDIGKNYCPSELWVNNIIEISNNMINNL